MFDTSFFSPLRTVTNSIPIVTQETRNYSQHLTNGCNLHLGQALKPFLYPLAIEYSLVTGSLFYKMLQRVGRNESEFLPGRGLQEKTSDTTNSSLPPTPRWLREFIPFLNGDTNGTDTRSEVSEIVCTKHLKYRQLLGCTVYLEPDLPEELDAQTGENNQPGLLTIKPLRSRQHDTNCCHRSHTGLFLGLMLFMASIIGIMSSISPGNKTLLRAIPHLYQYSKIFMLSVSTVACLLAIIQTNQMKFRPNRTGETFEYNLLGLGLVGCLTYHMLLFVPALEWMVHVMLYQYHGYNLEAAQLTQEGAVASSRENWADVAILYIVKCTLEILQATLQFYFIVEASRRGPCCKNQAIIKPGRSVIVFLLITNLALWLINTFEIRQSEHQLRLHKEYYGLTTWSVITCCFIPLIIFFRFHSTICLAQIWSTLYKLR